jgi:hypothetical protein
MTTEKQYRGRGLANNLFEVQLSLARLPKDKSVIFGLARSAHAGTSLQVELTKIMLECERIVNGETNGKINVRGEWVDTRILNEILGVDLSTSSQETGSNQTIHLFKKQGAGFVGFSKNMAPVWVVL